MGQPPAPSGMLPPAPGGPSGGGLGSGGSGGGVKTSTQVTIPKEVRGFQVCVCVRKSNYEDSLRVTETVLSLT